MSFRHLLVMSKSISSLLVLVLVGTSAGCSLMPHALQPSQLRKLNRGPALGRDTTNFSIPDPHLPDRKTAEQPGADPFRTE